MTNCRSETEVNQLMNYYNLTELQADIDGIVRPSSDPSNIKNEFRKVAEKELHETPEALAENIRKLRILVEGVEGLHARMDDIFLSAFLRGRKHNVEKAFQCVKQYYDFKAKYPDYYSYCVPSECSVVYDLGHFASIPGEDRLGRKMCGLIPAKIDLDKSPLDESFRMGTTIFEIMMEDPTLQVMGTIVIIDLAELTIMQQARLISPSLAWHLTNIIQDKIPLRVKAVHVINQPFYFNAIYAVFRPFLKKKLRKRIFLHGRDMQSLHKHIDPVYLPVEWGGSRPTFNNRATRTYVRMNEHKFKEWKQYGYKSEVN
ncbi:clavesin-2-like [Macrosteles quadrilineatus]|uniref:clavesin-2-like n=1 Tax=Macrosteles quadrilineatus TaxID=74068 RepID=UPI0023E13E27|nr:clavesin-2-like [Macrosteles quadrilineatus]